MNSKRLYLGDLYYNDGLETPDSYKINLVEKDVLLVKFGNRYIRANHINSKFDLINLYTILKYYPTTYSDPLVDYMYKTNDKIKGVIFVDNKSLRRYVKDNYNVDFNKLKTFSLIHDWTNKQ